MKHLVYVFALALTLLFAACGDDDSSFAPRDDDSSVESSSSSVTPSSNSSITSSNNEIAENSSSSHDGNSSSSACLETAWDYLNPNIDYGEMVDDRDGQIYKTVTIGSQIWMAENLNYEVDSSFCYNDSAKYCRMFGRLYRWAAAIGKSERECGYGNTCGLSGKVRGVCPEGWHLPDTTEWRTLINEVGEDSTAGYILKSQTGWLYGDNGSDVYGFSVLPAGYRSCGDSFDKGIYADFWSATEVNNKISAYYMCLRKFDKEYADADLSYTTKDFGYSVRCIQD